MRGMDWFEEAGGKRREGVFADEVSRNSFIFREFGIKLPAGPRNE